MNLLKTKVLLSLFAALIILTTPLVSVLAAAIFRGGGDIYLAGNTSNPSAGWGDPMTAQNGDIFDFKVAIYNDGDTVAQNVRVRADLPTNISGTNVTSTIHIMADNAPEVTDTATIVGPQNSTTKSLTYFQGNGGHAVYIDNAGTHTLPETIASSGVTIGDVQPGPQNRVDIVFKATYSETPIAAAAPTVTATPTPTSTPAPAAPTASPTPVPQGQTGTVQCPAGYTQTVNGNNIICIQNQNQNVNNNNNSASTGPINVTLQGSTAQAAAPAAPAVVNKAPVGEVKTLPKTGLPIGAWALSGLLPVGLGMKKRFLKGDDSQSANYVWENREFLKNILG